MKNWLKENWLVIVIIGIILFLAFGLPLLYDYPTKGEYEDWKNNLTDEEIEDYMHEQREPGEFYAP